MKRIKIFFIILVTFSVAGCLKDEPNVNFSNISPIAEISTSNINPTKDAPSGGLDYFGQATLPSFSTDTSCNCYLPFEVTFNVNITGEFPPTSDVNVTLAVDDAKRLTSNAHFYSLDTNAVKFEATPDSIYSFTTKSVVVKAGSRLAKVTVTFFPDKINPSNSYLLPISITDASGIVISGNLGTIYLHVIGNPLAGSYKWDFTRWNAQDSTSVSPVTADVGKATTFVPVSPTQIHVITGYYVQPNYLISFTNTNGVLSDFKVEIDPAEYQTAFVANGISVVDGPNILYADPVNKVFEFQYSVFNGTAYRYLKDKFYK